MPLLVDATQPGFQATLSMNHTVFLFVGQILVTFGDCGPMNPSGGIVGLGMPIVIYQLEGTEGLVLLFAKLVTQLSKSMLAPNPEPVSVFGVWHAPYQALSGLHTTLDM